MTALIIIAGILGVLLLLLLSPVRLHLRYGEEGLRAYVWYLFVRVNLSPDAVEKKLAKRAAKAEKKEKKAKKNKPDKPEKEAKTKEKRSFSELWPIIKQLLLASKKALRRICRHTVIYKVKIRMAVSRPDAHKTGVVYGWTCALVATLISVCSELFTLREPDVYVFPDFTKDKNRYDISLRVRIQPIILISAAVTVAIAAAKAVLGAKRRPAAKQKGKGGSAHESAASYQ